MVNFLLCCYPSADSILRVLDGDDVIRLLFCGRVCCRVCEGFPLSQRKVLKIVNVRLPDSFVEVIFELRSVRYMRCIMPPLQSRYRCQILVLTPFTESPKTNS